MTEKNRRENVSLELEAAERCATEATTLRSAGLWSGAVSRAYYAMFHLGRALLFSLEMEARTHAGMVHLLSLHLVRPGQFPAQQVRSFSQMQRLREDADYQTAVLFDEAAARLAEEQVNAFRQATLECLRARGDVS